MLFSRAFFQQLQPMWVMTFPQSQLRSVKRCAVDSSYAAPKHFSNFA